MLNLAADTADVVVGNIVAVAVGVLVKDSHVFAGNVDGNIVKGSFHDTAGPARLVGLFHLLVTVGGRRGRKQKGTADPAAEELRFHGDRFYYFSGNRLPALGGLVYQRFFRFGELRCDGEGGVLAGCHGFHYGGGAIDHIAAGADATRFFFVRDIKYAGCII